MNRTFIISIILFTLILNGEMFGQIPEFKNQRGFEYRLSDYLDTIGFEKADFKLVSCDFRIWHNNYSTGQKKLIRLQLRKDGTWTGKTLEYYCYNKNSCDMENFITDGIDLSDTWKKTWNTIVNDDLINIETQKTVNDRLKNEINEILMVTDGDGYVFEIATKKSRRAISYDNAVNYNDFLLKHGVESEEYIGIVRLIVMIEKEFGFGYKIQGVNERD